MPIIKSGKDAIGAIKNNMVEQIPMIILNISKVK